MLGSFLRSNDHLLLSFYSQGPEIVNLPIMTSWPALHPPLNSRLPAYRDTSKIWHEVPRGRYKANSGPVQSLQGEIDQLDREESKWADSVG